MGLMEDIAAATAQANDREAADNIVAIVTNIASLIGMVWGLIAFYKGFDQQIPLTIMICSVAVSFISYFICCWIHSRSFAKPILALVFLGGGSCLLYLLPANNIWIFEWGMIFYIQIFLVTFFRGFLPD